jgi:hypothetical protein
VRILGVDPGGSGALALIGLEREVLLADMPVFLVKRGKSAKAELDTHHLIDLLDRWAPDVCYFEQVGGIPGQSASAAFNFGRIAGACEALVKASGAQFNFVTPATWKRAMGVSGDKDEARAKATNLFPANASDFRRKKDDGRAEAALLAEYGRRLEAASLFA